MQRVIFQVSDWLSPSRTSIDGGPVIKARTESSPSRYVLDILYIWNNNI